MEQIVSDYMKCLWDPLDKSALEHKGFARLLSFYTKNLETLPEKDKMSDETPSKETLKILVPTIKKVTKDLTHLI